MPTPRRFFTLISAWLLIALCVTSCTQVKPLGHWQGPTNVGESRIEPWSYGERPGHVLVSDHYCIYTTLEDADALERALPRLMEGALQQYRFVAPVPSGKPNSSPMICFLFGEREDWADFTARNTGADASIYLKINRGGYTIGDRYVAYYIGDVGTYSVAAHEGWHQYCARNFIGRLPPFLEEGIACMFETVHWEHDLPRWNLSINPTRVSALREAMEQRRLLPLERLVALHAGRIVKGPPQDVEAFYAQCWAFARFLWEADGEKYRPALQKLLVDTAAGTVRDPTHSHQRASAPWNSSAVQPILETYLGMNLMEIEASYRIYLKKIAFDDYAAQWK